jgi:hypothetical protein
MKLFFERLVAMLVVLVIGVVVTIWTGSILALGITLILAVGAPRVIGKAQKTRAAK